MSDSDSDQNVSITNNEQHKRKVDWKTFRAEKKRQHKEWKEKKLIKSLEKLEKAKAKATAAEKESELDRDEQASKKEVPTVSIAVPGSIVENAQCPELWTLLAGQVARAASIACVDEIIVYDDKGSSNGSGLSEDTFSESPGKHPNPNLYMARILRYLECPQYLRKYFFPLHKDLRHAGLLPPLDSPHHLRESDVSKFREGVILQRPVKDGHGSFVNVGLRKDVQLDKKLEEGSRVTVRIPVVGNSDKKRQRCHSVDTSTPRIEEGLYWGYSVRLAQSLGTVFTQCPYQGSYDLTIGTSDKGTSVYELSALPDFRHLLIVFGGVKGLEYALDCDEALTVDDPKELFSHYINTFPGQGSRTIRTEEAIIITLAVLRPKIQQVIDLARIRK